MKRRNKRGARLLSLALAVIALCAPCVRAEEIPQLLEPVGVQLDTAVAYIGEMSKITAYNASVTPYVEGLYFPVSGTVAQVHVIVGQEVRAGDVLVTLDQEAQRKRLEELREEVEAVQTDAMYADALARIDRSILEMELQQLAAKSPEDKDAIALKKLDIEEFELNVRLEEELRRTELARLEGELVALEAETLDATLTAPFDGQVMFLPDVKPGDHVGAYAPVVYLADDTRLTIESEYISESAMMSVHEIYALAGGGRCELIAVELDQSEYIKKMMAGETVMRKFEIASSDVELSAGMYAAVCVVNGYHEEALLVPANALYSDSTGRYVYVVEDGARVRRDVSTGAANDWQVQIKEGLEEGEIVYVKD